MGFIHNSGSPVLSKRWGIFCSQVGGRERRHNRLAVDDACGNAIGAVEDAPIPHGLDTSQGCGQAWFSCYVDEETPAFSILNELGFPVKIPVVFNKAEEAITLSKRSSI